MPTEEGIRMLPREEGIRLLTAGLGVVLCKWLEALDTIYGGKRCRLLGHTLPACITPATSQRDTLSYCPGTA